MENLRALGFVRLVADGTPYHLEELPARLDLTASAELLVIVDRLTPTAADAARLAGSTRHRLRGGRGHRGGARATSSRLRFTEFPACSACDTPGPDGEPRALLVQQSPGRLLRLQRLRRHAGVRRVVDRAAIRPAASADGAIDPWTKPRYENRRKVLLERAKALGVDSDRPWSKIKASDRRELLYGRKGRYLGIFPFLKGLEEKRYKQYIRVFLRQYQLAQTCAACGGARLNPDALAVRIGDATIADIAGRSVDAVHAWVGGLELGSFDRAGRPTHPRPAPVPPRLPP